ncbi:IS1595 family transposase [Flavobacterium sp. AG291]|uniref:IS1595 family transposase n=1 Tax=Flavobacterium sp. AG291 TaxID=2184000 RepID=UPI000E0AFE8F|nr:IS1595 family transposase [Flavobacterium sp. AG291]RDI13217.1 ISXO2 transposase-like protein [Flavobacterium sp. AG291]
MKIFNDNIKSVIQLIQAFPTEQSCIEHLEAIRWNGNVVSPFDKTSKIYKCKNNRYHCKSTGKYFNVKTNTIFDNTKIELQKWFLAIWIATSHKKGISSLQLSRDLNITQKSAWFMLQRIRNCFDINGDDMADNLVEVDETYVGGENKNKSLSKRKELHKNGMQTGGNHKQPVLGILERGGSVKGFVIDKAVGNIIKPIMYNNIKESAYIVTDGFGAYKDIHKHFHGHMKVMHDKKEYVRYEHFHTNTIEGFWSLLKRGIIGIYHFVSRKHLQKYVNEFSFRYNTRKQTDCLRFNLLLSNIENRITYKQLING